MFLGDYGKRISRDVQIAVGKLSPHRTNAEAPSQRDNRKQLEHTGCCTECAGGPYPVSLLLMTRSQRVNQGGAVSRRSTIPMGKYTSVIEHKYTQTRIVWS